MPKVSEQHLEARRAQILDGARRAFARWGYEGATVSRLEEEIGLSRGAIFNYYPDKWSLFYELASIDQHELLTLLADEGLDATIRHLTTESPEWLAVYMEVTRILRTTPQLMEEFTRRGDPEVQERAKDRLRAAYAQGEFRQDVSLDDIVVFINLIANGVALATSLGLPLNADAIVKLVHSGIDPQ
jgi:AcrR family transcriptional regulator